MEAVAHQRQHHIGVGQLLHAQGVVDTETPQQCAGEGGLQRRYFELVGHAPGGAVVPLEVIGVDGLRCTVEGVDQPVELRG
ncbi:hypothetical protein D3C84_703230 [compost metagenome]